MKTIDVPLTQIEKQVVKVSIMRLGAKQALVPVDVIPTGALSLDAALGVGGVPRGRVVEVYGPEASGKTTIALHLVAEAQKRGGMAAFVGPEHALDAAYAYRLGVELDNLPVSEHDYGEHALGIAEPVLRSAPVWASAVDSGEAAAALGRIRGAAPVPGRGFYIARGSARRLQTALAEGELSPSTPSGLAG